jgi:hypothetical protein
MAEMNRWPEHRCREEIAPSNVELELFESILNDATDEWPLQTCLAAHPHFMM